MKVKIKRFFTVIPVFILFFSCKSAPHIPVVDMHDSNFAPLDRGASVYFFADAKKARPIIDLLPFEELKSSQTRQMLDKTDHIAAALFPQESGRRFQLVALGHFPASMAKIAFSSNSNWKLQNIESGGSYWHSSADKLSIAMNSRQAFVLSSLSNTPQEPLRTAPGIEMPEGFNEFKRNAPLSFWLNNPAPIINRIIADAGAPFQIPVQEIYINLTPVASSGESQYEALIRLRFPNQTQARGMASILYFSSYLPNRSNPASVLVSRLFANVPYQNGRDLDIKTAYLSEGDIALLLAMFSLQ